MTAIWRKGRAPDVDPPDLIIREDGRPGTVDDYRAHRVDTRKVVRRGSGRTEMHIFPEIVGEVYYCPYGRVWGIRGDGVEPDSLPLDDPDATRGKWKSH